MGRTLAAILRRVPGLPSTVGRQRFERFVGSLPSHVSDVSARFHLNITLFRFEPPFERDDLLKPFEDTGMRNWPIHRLLLVDYVGEATRQFYRWADVTPVWLYLNDNDCRGVV